MFFDFGVVLAAVEKDVFDTAWKKIKENPDQFENPDFLENLNQELKKKYAYLIVRKDGEIIYCGIDDPDNYDTLMSQIQSVIDADSANK